jgi:Kef-type K+ transport system membrane component KefB
VEQVWYTATAWIDLALLASLISIRIGISVALVEIFLGFVAGNVGTYFGWGIFKPTPWINFLAGFASVVLTFLAGAEIEPEAFRRLWKPSLAIGSVSFLFPFLGCMAYAYYLGGWHPQSAQIAGIALSTTSMAVVYAVMVETGLNNTELGHPDRLFCHRPGHCFGSGVDFCRVRPLAGSVCHSDLGGLVAVALHLPLGLRPLEWPGH